MNIETIVKMSKMSKAEKSLLIFFEARATDYHGSVTGVSMNAEDFIIAEKWNEEGFVKFGRIATEHVNAKRGGNWCKLSDEAWEIAHVLRKERANRCWENKVWTTTEEKKELQLA